MLLFSIIPRFTAPNKLPADISTLFMYDVAKFNCQEVPKLKDIGEHTKALVIQNTKTKKKH